MADKDGAVSFQGPGQVSGAASPQEQAQGNETQPKYVTVEEAKRLADEAAEAAFRKAQSLVDQNLSKIDRARKEEAVTPQEPAQSGQAQAESADLDDPQVINGRVAELYQKYGMQVFEDEPEVAGINYATGKDFISSLEAALQKKAARLSGPSSQPTQQPARTPTNAGGTGSVPRPDLQAQYSAELQQTRRGDIEAIATLKEKYRKKGLEVW